MTTIPEHSRAIVRQRAHQRCERCGAPTPVGAWHHRRSRSVRDTHTHHPCNGVWLCHTCHRWAHAHPVAAHTGGWIVSRWVATPGEIPLDTVWGTRRHHCDGTYTFDT